VSDSHAAHGQAAYAVRFDWGPTGAAAVAEGADVAVVVDVLSFTTTVAVAVEAGATVLPYPWQDGGAAAFAAERHATLAVGRLVARAARNAGETDAVSLSPADMARSVVEAGVSRVVLPSPNGSSICFSLADRGIEVAAGSLRNATAVARWLRPFLEEGRPVAVIAAGERWPDGSLRPAVEDLWGAGAVLDALLGMDTARDMASPEAELAAGAFRAATAHLATALEECASGRELVGVGFADDVAMAAELDVSQVVPVLRDGEFRDCGSGA
jgi:2-phosphosulfolactate phosphatase